jgi:uncharacterized membrane protein YphA (DoxX/SURF4 family)
MRLPSRVLDTALSGLRLVPAAVFLAAGVSKLADPASFAKALALYQLLPSGTEAAFGVALALVEVLAGSLLLVGAEVRVAGRTAQGLLVLFIVGRVDQPSSGIDHTMRLHRDGRTY